MTNWLKVEFYANEWDDWTFGISRHLGGDEHGEFAMLEIGVGLFSICFLRYR
jgi:hypothetical protein